jgi:pyridoxine 4-dehydrogenase
MKTTFQLPGTSIHLNRMGYGAMQLAGPGVWGPPRDPEAAVAVLREAVALGVNHVDTSDFYGPHVTNQLIRRALHPYPKGLVIVTKIGFRRGADKSWLPAFSPAELTAAVDDNLRNLGLDALDVVNLRTGGPEGPSDRPIEEPLAVLAELKRKGKIRHIGISNVSAAQVAKARSITEIVCVQNHYNLAHRGDDVLIDDLARQASPTRRTSLWAASRRCNPRRSTPPRPRSARRPCRWRSRGSCSGRPTSCSFRGRRRWATCGRTPPRRR